MNSCQQLHELGQSWWLDNTTRDLLDHGALRHYINELSVTGLTSNSALFDEAVGSSIAYDQGISDKARSGMAVEPLFMALAIEDLCRAADLLCPVFDASHGSDGCVV